MNDDLKQRLLMTFALALTFMVIMQYVIGPQKSQAPLPESVPERDLNTPEDNASAVEQAVEGTGAPQDEAAETDETPATSAEPEIIADTIMIRRESDDPEKSFEAIFTARGAALKRYRLLGYYQTPDHEPGEELTLVDELGRRRMSLAIQTLGGTGLDERGYRLVNAPKDALVLPETVTVERNDEKRLVFETTIDDWRVRKIYTFADDTEYGFGLLVEVTNLSDSSRRLAYRLTGPAGIVPDDASRFGVVEVLSAAQPGGKDSEVVVERLQAIRAVREDDPAELADTRGGLVWGGVKNRFFATVLLAEEAGLPEAIERLPLIVDPEYVAAHTLLQTYFLEQRVAVDDIGTAQTMRDAILADDSLRDFFTKKKIDIESLKVEEIAQQLNNAVELARTKYMAFVNSVPVFVVDVPVGEKQSVTHAYRFYGGPAEDGVLTTTDPRLANVNSYTWSWFSPLSKLLLWLLEHIASIVGNYGVAMILLTILVKSALHPLTRKALASGHKMQKVAPKMKALQEKYKNDRAKLQQEMMRLYSEEGVSPMGGCLPMLIQLPLFFALYGAFAKGFASRQAVFIPGWIDDLSLPDHLFQLPFTVPFTEWEYFNLLPILYLILQIIHMSMQPKSEDPQVQQQQKMMKIMPIMFVFIFYTMPSGLVLYFTISSLYTIFEHWLIKRKLDPHDTPGTAVAAAGAGASGAPSSAPSTGAGVGIQSSGKKGKKKKR